MAASMAAIATPVNLEIISQSTIRIHGWTREHATDQHISWWMLKSTKCFIMSQNCMEKLRINFLALTEDG